MQPVGVEGSGFASEPGENMAFTYPLLAEVGPGAGRFGDCFGAIWAGGRMHGVHEKTQVGPLYLGTCFV